jgi:hypothetical protein
MTAYDSLNSGWTATFFSSGLPSTVIDFVADREFRFDDRV